MCKAGMGIIPQSQPFPRLWSVKTGAETDQHRQADWMLQAIITAGLGSPLIAGAVLKPLRAQDALTVTRQTAWRLTTSPSFLAFQSLISLS